MNPEAADRREQRVETPRPHACIAHVELFRGLAVGGKGLWSGPVIVWVVMEVKPS
jgi:hypothetical protein